MHIETMEMEKYKFCSMCIIQQTRLATCHGLIMHKNRNKVMCYFDWQAHRTLKKLTGHETF